MRSKRTPNHGRATTIVATLATVIVLPLVGAIVAGRDLSALLQFPPRLEIPADYPHFSWWAVALVLAALGAFGASWITIPRRTAEARAPHAPLPHRAQRARLPLWGWIALTWTLVWWVLAWNRWDWFSDFQRYTFFPLWLGFIVSVNALTERRIGTCLMLRGPRSWLTLFATSALFWWLFEWLNRFVHNWHYLGVEDFGAVSYAAHASLCFSTVLPAVAGVAEYLGTFSRGTHQASVGPNCSWLTRRPVANGLVLASAAALMLTGAYPVFCYPTLWLAPLVFWLGQSVLSGRESVAIDLARGRWAEAATWMAAALICGFFWELWNFGSVPKWIYAVPGVERWYVFEMPLLGYAGYLPFGLECLVVFNAISGTTSLKVEQ